MPLSLSSWILRRLDFALVITVLLNLLVYASVEVRCLAHFKACSIQVFVCRHLLYSSRVSARRWLLQRLRRMKLSRTSCILLMAPFWLGIMSVLILAFSFTKRSYSAMIFPSMAWILFSWHAAFCLVCAVSNSTIWLITSRYLARIVTAPCE